MALEPGGVVLDDLDGRVEIAVEEPLLLEGQVRAQDVCLEAHAAQVLLDQHRTGRGPGKQREAGGRAILLANAVAVRVSPPHFLEDFHRLAGIVR
jgi:hypothetical protein